MEQTRGAAALQETSTEDDLRRKLEGRFERLEQTRARLRALEERLGRFFWKQALRESPDALADAAASLRELPEHLDRLDRRAEAEGWAPSNPAQALAAEVRTVRDRVDRLARKRLGRLKSGFVASDLAQVLEKLASLALAPLPLDPSPTEHLLLEGRLGDSATFTLLQWMLYVPAIFSSISGWTRFLPHFYGALILLLGTLVLRSGRFWLTTERLLWKPLLGEPVEVPLHSLRDGGVKLSLLQNAVTVRGTRDVVVRYVENAPRLAALLEIRRRAPLVAAGHAERTSEVAIYDGQAKDGGQARSGTVVLRPDYALFLPEDTGTALLESLDPGPGRPAVPIPTELLLTQLKCLPEDRFDALLEDRAGTANAVLLRREDASHDRRLPAWREIRLTRGTVSLHGKVDWRQIDVADRILRGWKA